jgi:uncharacterized membrane protein YfcA
MLDIVGAGSLMGVVVRSSITAAAMKNHPPIFFFVPLVVVACYLGWSLFSGSVRIRGIKEPIRRRDSPSEYWRYMLFFLGVFAAIVGVFAWMFL